MDTVERAASPAAMPEAGDLGMADVPRRRAVQSPDAVAYTFISGREVVEESITYADLDRQARAIAASLQRECARGDRAVLVFEPGLAFAAAFFGCLYAGVVAVPIYPPRRNRGIDRIVTILRDCSAAVVLATRPMKERAAGFAADAPELAFIPWLLVDEMPPPLAADWRQPDFSPDDVAFLQYTSGSTSKPKGVILTHSNILHNEESIRLAFEHDRESVVVGWLPLFHDMGLIGNLLQPMYVGCRCILMSPMYFLQKPIRWLRAISHYRATTSGGPNFAYDLCVDGTSPEDREGLDLSTWSLAFNGAERVRPSTLERFAAAFAPYGFRAEAFYPCYGLAEGTLIVTGGRKADPVIVRARPDAGSAAPAGEAESGDAPSLLFAGCGAPLPGHDVRIVDPDSCEPVAEGLVGEIWIAGGNVARGYWNKPEETERCFAATIAGEDAGTRYFRTGDLGFVCDGEVFVTSRLKDIIIVHGRNLSPEDIESTVADSHPLLRYHGCAAVPIEHEGEEYLGVIVEIANRQAVDFDELAAAISRRLFVEHEVAPLRIVFIRSNTLPKTSSGKVQRYLCRVRLQQGTLDALAER